MREGSLGCGASVKENYKVFYCGKEWCNPLINYKYYYLRGDFLAKRILLGIPLVTLLCVVLFFLVIDNNEIPSVEAIKSNNYCIYIQIDEHKLYLLESGKKIKQYNIAAGKADTPSPLGYWKIIEKSTWGGGFGGRWMGLNVPWGTYGIHGTMKPESVGRDASHGCIRMYNKDVQELYKIVPHGTPVVIVNGSFGPFGKGFRVIKPGDRGADVFIVQKRLKRLDFYKGSVDGIYGEGMKEAVHNFQRKNKLYVTNNITREMYHALGFREFE